MKLFKKDIVADFCFSLTRSVDIIQTDGYKELKCKYIKNYLDKLSSFQVELFKIFDIIKVTRFTYSPYKIHKSYPSARSYYYQSLWLKTNDNYFVKKNIATDNIEIYEIDIEEQFYKYDILISSKQITLEQYRSIHKSLIMLEFGHILYNIKNICSIFNATISKVKITELGIYIKIDSKNIIEPTMRKLEKLYNLYYLRSSGKYYSGLINYDFLNRKSFYDLSINYNDVSKELFKLNLEHNELKILHFKNNGKRFICDNIVLEYHDLSSEYVYIDFRSCSEYTLFLVKKSIVSSNIISQIVLLIGYLAQDICLNNSKNRVYNRPLKQLLNKNLWYKLQNQDNSLSDYMQFYAVVSGYYI